MKIINKLGRGIFFTLLAFPIFIAILSTVLILSYSNSALMYLLGT